MNITPLMNAPLMNAEQLVALLDSPTHHICTVDCRFWLNESERGQSEYAQGHVPGAVYAHLDHDLAGPVVPNNTGRHPLPHAEEFARTLSSWGIREDTLVVAYDQGGGAIAARLWWLLRWVGHTAVAVLDGGMPAWLAVGGKVDDRIPNPSPSQFTARPNDAMHVTATDIEKHRFSVLVDSREQASYRGESEPIDPVAGHIPGAVNRPFAENLEAGHMKSANVLREEFEQLLPTGSDPGDAVFYCGSGVTAAHNLLAMAHAGLKPAKLYNGSWSEWIATRRPVATAVD